MSSEDYVFDCADAEPCDAALSALKPGAPLPSVADPEQLAHVPPRPSPPREVVELLDVLLGQTKEFVHEFPPESASIRPQHTTISRKTAAALVEAFVAEKVAEAEQKWREDAKSRRE